MDAQFKQSTVVRETWLTRKPHAGAAGVAMTTTLMLILVAAIYLLDAGGLNAKLDASGTTVFTHHQYWRLWTTVFAHGDLGHLASNVMLFYILGFFLNGYFGAWLFPIAALFWGGIINLIVLSIYEPEVVLVGASGVVYWMGGVWLVLYFFLSRQKNLTQRILRSLGVGLLIFMPSETFAPHVSYLTHFVGFAIGVAVGLWHYARNRTEFLAAEIREIVIEEEDPVLDEPADDQAAIS